MRKLVGLILLMIAFSYALYGQTNADTISISGGTAWEKMKYYQHGELISAKQVRTVIEGNEIAYAQFKKGQNNVVLGNVLAFTGGFLVGFQLGSAMAGGEANAGLLLAGGALIGVGIPINTNGMKQIKQSVDTYNNSITGTTSRNPVRLNFGLSANGVGLVLNF